MYEKKIDPKIQVLVVDDSDVMRYIICDHLKSLGVTRTKQAYNGKKALAVLEENEGEIDLIVSDWNMPGMQGIELLEKVRSREDLKNLPFLMVTAEKTTAHVLRAVKAGVSEFLPKPFTAEMLEIKILKALKPKNK